MTSESIGTRLEPPQIATLVGIAVLIATLIIFGLDIGIAAIVIALLLQFAFPKANSQGLGKVSWSVVILVCGVVTYVELLSRAGTVDALGQAVTQIDTPVLVALAICAVCTLSAVASSSGLIAAMIAVAIPFLASGQVSVLGMVAAIALSATVVDACPFSSTGALMVANAPEELQRPLYRGLMRWALAMIVITPVASVGLLVAPGW